MLSIAGLEKLNKADCVAAIVTTFYQSLMNPGQLTDPPRVWDCFRCGNDVRPMPAWTHESQTLPLLTRETHPYACDRRFEKKHREVLLAADGCFCRTAATICDSDHGGLYASCLKI